MFLNLWVSTIASSHVAFLSTLNLRIFQVIDEAQKCPVWDVGIIRLVIAGGVCNIGQVLTIKGNLVPEKGSKAFVA